LSNSPDSKGDSATLAGNRRRVPRYSFVATAEMTDAANSSRLSGRVAEISRYGCYMDSANTLPVDTILNISISCDEGVFATKGKILYVQEYIGMGIVFLETPEEQLKVLDSWLAKLLPTPSQ